MAGNFGTIAILAGTLIGKLRLERWVEDFVWQTQFKVAQESAHLAAQGLILRWDGRLLQRRQDAHGLLLLHLGLCRNAFPQTDLVLLEGAHFLWAAAHHFGTDALVKVNSIENQADDIFDLSIDRLFETEPDAKEVIKKREIYQVMELVTDKCEDAANVIESIIIKYA